MNPLGGLSWMISAATVVTQGITLPSQMLQGSQVSIIGLL